MMTTKKIPKMRVMRLAVNSNRMAWPKMVSVKRMDSWRCLAVSMMC